jgi:two-component system sensor histidine kinase and response regulator WspE
MSERDMSQMSMLELFQLDASNQIQVLTTGLLILERDATAPDPLETCMRAAHSLKGAASIVGLKAGVGVAHAMEDCLVAAQRGTLILRPLQIDVLLRGADLLNRIASTPEAEAGTWADPRQADVLEFTAALKTVLQGQAEQATPPAGAEAADGPAAPEAAVAPFVERRSTKAAEVREHAERVLRVNSDALNRLLGLAGESLVESRRVKAFSTALLRLKRLHEDAGRSLEKLADALSDQGVRDEGEGTLSAARQQIRECHQALAQRLDEMNSFESRSVDLAHRLYEAALSCRMRPFADGVRNFGRMVRDLGRSLGKEVRLVITGETTQVDRDILDKLDAPLGHLLRNAIDHGIESAQARRAAGKPAEGVIGLSAHHSAGLLQITVSDDGYGVDPARVRRAVVERKLAAPEVAEKLTEAELMEFLFLPGFSMKEEVTEISGRGVGLDVVQNMVKQVRGVIRVSSQPGRGTRFQLQLPLSLSVVRTLLVDVGGENYAFPLAHIVRTVKLPRERIHLLEGRQHFELDGRSIGLVSAHQILGSDDSRHAGDALPVIVVGDAGNSCGLVMDRFIGECELVVHPLDPRLGKIKDIAAGALMEDGSPVLIVDVEDLLRSVDKLVSAGGLSQVEHGAGSADARRRKRILVVDDSLTVRELERKLLDHAGYEVEVAVDGMDGWNVVRTGQFDLIVSDIDMPRMDGIELVSLIRRDPKLKSLPVMIVSYKDREQDRQRGLEAGADYYLTKSSFQDEGLLRAVADLIGEAAA